jgi:hypothetical protein
MKLSHSHFPVALWKIPSAIGEIPIKATATTAVSSKRCSVLATLSLPKLHPAW